MLLKTRREHNPSKKFQLLSRFTRDKPAQGPPFDQGAIPSVNCQSHNISDKLWEVHHYGFSSSLLPHVKFQFNSVNQTDIPTGAVATFDNQSNAITNYSYNYFPSASVSTFYWVTGLPQCLTTESSWNQNGKSRTAALKLICSALILSVAASALWMQSESLPWQAINLRYKAPIKYMTGILSVNISMHVNARRIPWLKSPPPNSRFSWIPMKAYQTWHKWSVETQAFGTADVWKQIA